jgi:hypothetical protein
MVKFIKKCFRRNKKMRTTKTTTKKSASNDTRKLTCLVAILLVLNVIAFTVLNALFSNNEVEATTSTSETTDVFSTTTDSTSNTTIETTSTTETTIVENEFNPVEISLEEKYSSVFAWQVYGGDFGVEHLYFLNEQCEKYDIPMELMLAIICTESGFRSNAKASTSSASGYCQIIKSTAKWIYEDKLHYGTYDVNNHREIMCTNWKLNIEISCRLMKCLYANNSQSWEKAVKKYYGSTSESANSTYLNKVNSNMSELFDMTTIDLINK